MSDSQVAEINSQRSLPSGELAHMEFDQLVLLADPSVKKNKHLFNQIGLHCSGLEDAYVSLRIIIDQLRAQRIYLLTDPSLQVAKSYIWE